MAARRPRSVRGSHLEREIKKINKCKELDSTPGYHGAQGWQHETPGYPVQHLASHQAGDGEGGQEGDQDSGDASQECRQEQEPLWQEFSLISEMDLVHK